MESIQMLHLYQDAHSTKLRCNPATTQPVPGWELFSLLDGVNRCLAGASPYIQSSLHKNAVSVHILYRNVAFIPDDFWDLFGYSMGQINSIWPICAFSTAENQETIRLTASLAGNELLLLQQSISGKSASVLHDLCIQLDCADNQSAELLIRLLSATNWENNIIALDNWSDAGFLREQELFIKTDPPGYFCYGSINQDVTTRDMIFSLNFGQKIVLWKSFLRDGLCPAEFEWISDEIASDTLDNRLEWEMALWEALDQLDFKLVNKAKSFEVFNGEGQRVYFGSDGLRAAERAFMKMIFPLN